MYVPKLKQFKLNYILVELCLKDTSNTTIKQLICKAFRTQKGLRQNIKLT